MLYKIVLEKSLWKNTRSSVFPSLNEVLYHWEEKDAAGSPPPLNSVPSK